MTVHTFGRLSHQTLVAFSALLLMGMSLTFMASPSLFQRALVLSQSSPVVCMPLLTLALPTPSTR